MKVDVELLERYRSNNTELALALNDLKTELETINSRLLDRERDFQTIYGENAALRKDLAERDNQINVWRTMFIDLVQTNTRKYTEVMQKIGLVPTPNGINKTSNGNSSQQLPSNTEQVLTTPLMTKKKETNDRLNGMRRRRFSIEGSPNYRLANLTEESVNSQINDSESLTPTSPAARKPACHVTARRRATIPPVSPVSSPPKKRDSKIPKSSLADSTPMLKISESSDENTPQNTNGRPSRRTAPKNLAEPKLRTKLRRN